MISIPYALTYSTTVRGRLPKLVQCEKCATEYVYLLEDSVSAESTSYLFLDNEGARESSANQAEQLLRQVLVHGCEVVPCISCGHVQEHMVPRARQLRLRWMGIVGKVLLAAAAILILPALIYLLVDKAAESLSLATRVLWIVVSVAAFVGIQLLIWRWKFINRFDPNAEPADDRKLRGQQLAVTKDEYLKMTFDQR